MFNPVSIALASIAANNLLLTQSDKISKSEYEEAIHKFQDEDFDKKFAETFKRAEEKTFPDLGIVSRPPAIERLKNILTPIGNKISQGNEEYINKPVYSSINAAKDILLSNTLPMVEIRSTPIMPTEKVESKINRSSETYNMFVKKKENNPAATKVITEL